MDWDSINIFLLLASLISVLSLGIFVYLRNKAHLLNKIFLIFSLNIAFWTFAVFMIVISPDGESLVFWGRLVFAITVLVPPNFLLFAIALSQRELPPLRITLKYYAIAIILSIISLTPLQIRGHKISETGQISADYGPALPIFFVYFLIFMGGIFYYLARKIKIHTGFKRLQFQYIFFGMLIYTVLAIFTGLIAPLFGLTATEISSLTPTFALIWVGFVGYAIAKYHLMDISIVIKRTTQYALLTASITVGYIGLVVLSNWLFGGIMGLQTLIPAMIAALLIAFAFAPLKEIIQIFIDKTLFKRRYDHRKILRDLSEILASIFKLKELLDLIIKVITKAMGVGGGTIYLLQPGKGDYVLQADQGKVNTGKTKPFIKADDPLIGRFQRSGEIIIREQLERIPVSHESQSVIGLLQNMEVGICIPIFSKESLTGILFLGDKETGEIFTREDIEMFSTLSHHIAVAIENAQLYTKAEESKIYQEILLNSLTNGVIASDLNGKITAFNRKAEELLEINVAQAIGSNVDTIAPGLREPLLATLRQRETLSNKEITIKMHGEKEIPLAVGSSIFKSHEGKALGSLIVFSDLTERKILEAEMRRADRLVSLGTLAAGIAHEIKNPLVSLKTFAQLLPEQYMKKSFREDFSRLAGQEVDRINQLVEQLLGFARPVSPTFQSTDLEEILENTLLLLKSRLSKQSVVVKKDIRVKPLKIMADGEQLRQVFLNIIINALQSMEGGGTMTIEVGLKRAADLESGLASAFPRLNKRDCAVVTISDTGSGIEPEDLHHLFDPFFTTKETGAGLGLSIVHSIIKEHGGIIDVKSKIGEGTTFIIILPLTARPEGEKK